MAHDHQRFGRLLRLGRIGAGLTQRQVAERVGVTQSAVSAWEMGRTLPPLDAFRHLVELLDLDPKSSLDTLTPEAAA